MYNLLFYCIMSKVELTVDAGEFVGLIIGTGLLLLTLISFLIIIIICMRK